MKAFIKKHEYNYIKRRMNDLNNTFGICADINIIEANKAYIFKKILNIFGNLSEEEKEILDINKISTPLHIEKYLADLDPYVYGMPKVTNGQISRLFKKEKKLKLPNLDSQDSKNVYLGWIDNSIRKLFVAYNMDGKLVGMACRISNNGSNHTRRCILCNHVAKEDEVAFVSPICKTNNSNEGAYRSIGFDMCLDSAKCNERIASIEQLEDLLRDVNNMKP